MTKPALEERPSKINRAARPERTPINGYRDILSVAGKEPGFHYCWVNEDKVPRYESALYEFVTHDVKVGDRRINAASQVGGKITLAVGNGVTAYLMRVLDEYYDEDMAKLNTELDELEAGLRANFNSKADGRYGNVETKVTKGG
jgi:hypothetical protein